MSSPFTLSLSKGPAVIALLLAISSCQCIDTANLITTACESDGSCKAGKRCCPDNTCRATCTGGQGGGGGGSGGGTGGGGIGGGSGGGTGGGAASCDSTNCAGCCQGTACQNPPQFALCGTQGAMCAQCPPATSDNCDTGACSCGDAGLCGQGQLCVGGACVCNSSSCAAGCCQDGGCVAYADQSLAVCGTQGDACAGCAAGLTSACVGGTCRCGGSAACLGGQACADAGVGVTCVCTPSTCPGGCCLGNSCAAIAPIDAGTADPVVCRADGGACAQCAVGTSDRCDGAGRCRCGGTAPCSAGQRCLNGGCICDAASCAGGCCSGNRCRAEDVHNCRAGSGPNCLNCPGSNDTCVAGPDGCRCGTQVCAATQRCENGRCECQPELCAAGGGCCDRGTGQCVSPQTNNACGQAATCATCDGGSCVGGKCDSCQVSCPTCCLGMKCVPGATDGGSTPFPYCGVGASATNQACVACDPVTADRCGGNGCECGAGGAPCQNGDRCNAGGFCECNPKTCKGCCLVISTFSTCVGTLSASSCALYDGTNALTCVDCNATGATSDTCSAAGTCSCGTNAPCVSPARCLGGSCFNP